MNKEEIEDILEELHLVRPEILKPKAKKLFEAIMSIADERDELQQENKQLKEINEEHKKLNGELREENKKYKEVIDKVSSQIKLYGKYNGEKCTRGFSMMSADFNKLLEILKEVE